MRVTLMGSFKKKKILVMAHYDIKNIYNLKLGT